MNFKTNAAIFGTSYGTVKYNKETKTNDFTRLGKAVFVDEIQESIETTDVKLKLAFDYNGEKTLVVPRSVLVDKTKISDLANAGIDVTLKFFNVFVDTIRMQEQELLLKGENVVDVFEHLGWIEIPDFDNDGSLKSLELCYRAHELIGAHNAKYVGSYLIEPMGEFEPWREMVISEVVGRGAAEIVLIASLTSVIVGLLAMRISVENPILHVYYLSGKGKSTLAALSASVSGQPFQGEKKVFDMETGCYRSMKSLMQSWASTANAIVTSQAGNRGVPTILDELGKYRGKNPADVIFNFSEGSDVKRLNSQMQDYISEGYSTAFISFGESSLLDKCQDKLEGLNVRVLEINKPLTDSAAQARKIKNTVMHNNGWAAPMLAEHIINHGGVDAVLKIYNTWVDELTKTLPLNSSGERVVEKFYALFITTAQIASAALNIPFDIDGILNFFIDHEKEHGAERNISASSYEVVLEACSVNRHKFYRKELYAPYNRKNSVAESSPLAECWGRISKVDYELTDGRKVIEEIEIYPSAVEGILAKNGFPNKKTCFDAWKTADLIDYEDSKNYRKRKVDPFSNELKNVVVFRIFDDSKKVFSKLAQTCETAPLVTGKEVSFDDNMAHTA